MKLVKSATIVLSLFVLLGFLLISGLFIAVEGGLINLSPEQQSEGPTNTSGVPVVNASDHPEVNGKALEHAIYQEVNNRREAAGLEPFVHSERVRLIARLHSYDMAERDFFDHTNPDGQGSLERHKEFNGCENTNENIFKWSRITTYNNTKIAEETVDWWSDSEGHNTSMLTPYDKVTGVGVHVTEDGDLYVTQNFCREHPNA